ncbi:MAG: LytTR family DNA-binding domain-containing protein [Acidobacteriota bacterium]
MYKTGKTEKYLSRVPIKKTRGKTLFLPVDRIDWIEAANQYVVVYCGRSRHLIRVSMTRMLEQLDPDRFKRLHRSAIVNLDRIHALQVETPTRRWVFLEDGRRIPVSPKAWNGLHQELAGGVPGAFL